MISYERLKKLRVGDATRMNALMAQLRGMPQRYSAAHYTRVIRQHNLVKIVARNEGGAIIGMATVYIEDTDAARIAHVADVVVDAAWRGKGIGEELNRRLIAIARAKNAAFLELTSNPQRKAARMLYEKLGYRKRETDVFRKSLRD